MRKSIQLIKTLLNVQMVKRKSNDITTGSIKGGKDSGDMEMVIWQLYHQHRWNLVPM